MTLNIPEDVHRDEEILLHQIWELARLSRRRVAGRLETLGLTPGRVRALRAISRTPGPLRIGGLAVMLDIAPRSATAVVDELATDGLVERVPDPDDRRATLIELTAIGKEVVRSAAEMRSAVAAELFDALSGDERTRLRDILEKTVDQAGLDQPSVIRASATSTSKRPTS